MKRLVCLDRFLLLALPLLIVGCNVSSPTCELCDLDKLEGSGGDILRAEDVQWTALNPARGDKSPQAANLWGDRAEMGATGFLVKFVDGFSSPPHIHNVTYRGAVVAGGVHNDDPGAANMWMPAGSFWTQPAGEVHITSAKGKTNIAYIEIDSGPYLVHPPDQAFDKGERPVNVHQSNLVWVEQAGGVEYAYLWGDPDGEEPYGVFVKLPAGFKGTVNNASHALRSIVIQGKVDVATSGTPSASLGPGSYFGSDGKSSVAWSIKTDDEVQIYTRASGPFEVVAD